MRNIFFVALTACLALITTGCGEITYPREKLEEAVIKMCKTEYGMDVDASIAGSTLGIYLPITNLFDVTLNLSEKAQDKVQNVLLSASRVALSTDADIKFYCVIAQDAEIPEIQLVIIKYVDDVKRAFYRDISRGEYFKRTLIDINENPQSKKEKAIVEVFEKMELDQNWQDKVLDDFFRSAPNSLEGIGYWNEKFYIKDITLKEFLAEQMASRVKSRFREEEPLQKYALKMVTGKFMNEEQTDFFLMDFSAESLLFILDPMEKIPMEKEIFTSVFREMSDAIYGYKFNDFDLIKIIEKNTDKKLFVSKEEIYLFKKGKLGLDVVLGGVQ